MTLNAAPRGAAFFALPRGPFLQGRHGAAGPRAEAKLSQRAAARGIDAVGEVMMPPWLMRSLRALWAGWLPCRGSGEGVPGLGRCHAVQRCALGRAEAGKVVRG